MIWKPCENGQFYLDKTISFELLSSKIALLVIPNWIEAKIILVVSTAKCTKLLSIFVTLGLSNCIELLESANFPWKRPPLLRTNCYTINLSANVTEFHYFVMLSLEISLFCYTHSPQTCIILYCTIWFHKFPPNAFKSVLCVCRLCRETVMDMLKLKDFSYQEKVRQLPKTAYRLLIHWGFCFVCPRRWISFH